MSVLPKVGLALSGMVAAGAYTASSYPTLPFKSKQRAASVGMHISRIKDGPQVAVYYPVEPPDMHSSAGAGAGASAGGGTEVEVHGYIREAVLDCVKNKVGDRVPRSIFKYLITAGPYVKDGTILGLRGGGGGGTRRSTSAQTDQGEHVKQAVAPTTARAGYPVVLFSHGLWGTLEMYSSLCAGMAEAGYIVVAMEHEDGSALAAWTADGAEVPSKMPPKDMVQTKATIEAFRQPFLDKRVREMRATARSVVSSSSSSSSWVGGGGGGDRVLSEILSCADTERLFLVGHSFGAATVVRASQELGSGSGSGVERSVSAADADLDLDIARRVKASVVMDLWSMPLPEPVLSKGIPHPVLFITSEDFIALPEIMRHTRRVIATSNEANGGRAQAVTVGGIAHQSFSDTPYFLPQQLGKRLRCCGELDRDVAYQAIMGTALGFLAASGGAPVLDTVSAPAAGVVEVME